MDTEIIDLGLDRIALETHKLASMYAAVGLPLNGTVNKGNGNNGISDMSELVTVGSVHEFGAPNKGIPKRSFMRAGFDNRKKDVQKIKEVLFDKVVTGKISAVDAVKTLGVFGVDVVKRQIDKITTPALKVSTLKRRINGGSKPLVDTGGLRNSIQFVLRSEIK